MRRHTPGRRLPAGRALIATALSTVALVGLLPGSASAAPQVMVGVTASTKDRILSEERSLGQPFRAVRVYEKWDSRILSSHNLWARDTGHHLFLSVRATRLGGSKIRFADIARAQPGSALYADMERIGRDIREFRAPISFIFQHEPEARESRANGNGAEFAAAWRKLVTVMRSVGASNAKFTWTMTGYGFTRRDGYNARAYYPGDAFVDAIGGDVYNWGSCRGRRGDWDSLAQSIEGMRQFGRLHPGKELVLPEWGSVEDRSRPGRKAEWIREVTRLLQRPDYRQFTAIVNYTGFDNSHPGCDFSFDSSASSRQALNEMMDHPHFKRR